MARVMEVRCPVCKKPVPNTWQKWQEHRRQHLESQDSAR
jgi:endogenous inhibitor of DNA gyrase (YacG/DUF329 family)